MPTILEQRRTNAANDLAGIVAEAETLMARDDFNPDGAEYVALRESRVNAEAHLADITATIAARALAEAPALATVAGEPISDFRRILREYDPYDITTPVSRRADLPYILREVTTNDPYFKPNPTRIQVADLPVITPTLDSVRQIQTGQTYDFVVPPPPVPASSVAEGGLKPTRTWTGTKIAGSLSADAHVIDVSVQSLEDDATAEATFKNWLADGVRLAQEAKAAAAIAGATGTGTASGPTLLAAIRAGKAELTKIGVPATNVYLHPDDASAIDLSVMENGHTGPEGNSILWGMSVVENPGLTAGTAVVGSMPNAVYFLYRNAIRTDMTNAGTTNEATPRERFEHNLVGIRGEGRSAVHVVQPKLLVKCSATVTPLAASAKK